MTSTSNRVAALGGAGGFLLAYLASQPVSARFATSPSPQPNVTGAVTRAWIVENTAANTAQAVMMAVSIAFLAVFVAALASITRGADGPPARRTAVLTGVASVIAMAVS